jgi:hypothetical protein
MLEQVLRVVNDDLVKAHAGFGTHPHRDMVRTAAAAESLCRVSALRRTFVWLNFFHRKFSAT